MSRLALLLLAFVLLPVAASASSLGEPRVRGGVVSPPVAYGNFVCAASGISFEVWNIADTAHPAKVPFAQDAHAAGPIFGLAIVGDFLYVGWSDDARTTGGFDIYSLADPAHPLRAGEADAQHADRLLTNGAYLYAVDNLLGVTAIDTSDPLHPVVAGSATGSVSFPDSIHSAEIANGHLYISGSASIEISWGIIFDLADPRHPVSVGTIPLSNFGMIGAVSDSGYALTFGEGSGIYDVRDPAHVASVGALPTGPVFGGTAAFRGDDDLYLFGGPVLPVFDLSSPSQPAQIAAVNIDTSNVGSVTRLTNGFLATTLKGPGLLIDASVPTAPTLSGEIAVPNMMAIVDAAIDDRTAYVIGEGHALEIVDTASLENVGVLDAPADDQGAALAGAISIGVSGTTAIVGGYLALLAVDVADHAHPRVVGSLPADFYGTILVSGDRAYTPTYDGALTVIDISDPTALVVRGSVPGAFSYQPLAASGSLVFAYGTDLVSAVGVYIIDARDASHPAIAGTYVPCYGSSFDTLAAGSNGGTLAVACSDASVEIVDTRDPSTPTLVATYRPADPTDETGAIAANGTTFYLGNRHGIDEIDASDPAAPAFVVRHPTASWVQALRMSPSGSLLALTSAGMYVFDCVASQGERPAPCHAGATIVRAPHAHSQHGAAR